MVSKVTVCFNAIHNSFKDQLPIIIEPIDESKPALKIIRAALRAMEIDPESSDDYELRRCRCNGEGKVAEEALVARKMKVQDMDWNDVERVFLRKVQVKEIEINQGNDFEFRYKEEDADKVPGFKLEDLDDEHFKNNNNKKWGVRDDEEEDERVEKEEILANPAAPLSSPSASEGAIAILQAGIRSFGDSLTKSATSTLKRILPRSTAIDPKNHISKNLAFNAPSSKDSPRATTAIIPSGTSTASTDRASTQSNSNTPQSEASGSKRKRRDGEDEPLSRADGKKENGMRLDRADDYLDAKYSDEDRLDGGRKRRKGANDERDIALEQLKLKQEFELEKLRLESKRDIELRRLELEFKEEIQRRKNYKNEPENSRNAYGRRYPSQRRMADGPERGYFPDRSDSYQSSCGNDQDTQGETSMDYRDWTGSSNGRWNHRGSNNNEPYPQRTSNRHYARDASKEGESDGSPSRNVQKAIQRRKKALERGIGMSRRDQRKYFEEQRKKN